MKFFKISLLLSIVFIGFNTIKTSAPLKTGNPELEQMAMDGVGATPKTKIIQSVAKPEACFAAIDTKFQESLNNLQFTAMQNLAQQVADYIVKNYSQMIAKALVNQIFPQSSKVVTLSASDKTTAEILLNTLTVTLGQEMQKQVIEKLKKRF
ncbi:MAG: hypothetical protein EBU90_21150 [Proteobacteria bacterium]|nr:hypothetical protein [Pseudomonadota bacterium]NBP15206.1 hypothetical protein [bacterium]